MPAVAAAANNAAMTFTRKPRAIIGDGSLDMIYAVVEDESHVAHQCRRGISSLYVRCASENAERLRISQSCFKVASKRAAACRSAVSDPSKKLANTGSSSANA